MFCCGLDGRVVIVANIWRVGRDRDSQGGFPECPMRLGEIGFVDAVRGIGLGWGRGKGGGVVTRIIYYL